MCAGWCPMAAMLAMLAMLLMPWRPDMPGNMDMLLAALTLGFVSEEDIIVMAEKEFRY